jgi:hypothetical protein
MESEELLEAALEAIREVHGDTSVSQEETLQSLQTIIDEAEMLADAVRKDIESDG